MRPTLPSPARLAWLAAALLLLAPVPARAVDDVKADTWTVSDGLPQNTVTGLAQDERGYLWVATRKGLARFDGLEVQAAGIVDGIDLSTRRLTALVHDGAGLWIGTYGTGLFYLRDGRLKAFGPDEGIPAGTIWDLRRDRRGRVWAATAGGARVLEHGTWQAPAVPDGAAHAVSSVVVDRLDRTWLGSSTDGVIRLDADGTRRFGTDAGLPSRRVFSLSEDADGRIWAATPRGVARFDEARQRFAVVEALRGVHAYQVLVARTGDAWVATYGRGLLRVTADGSVTAIPQVGSDFVVALTEDRDGAIWVGTVSGGLTRLLHVERELIDHDDGMPNFPVTTVYQARDGAYWAGTLGGGLVRLDAGTRRRLARIAGLPSDSITSVAGASGPSQVWVGTNGAGAVRVADGRVVEQLGPEVVGPLVRTIEHGGRGRYYFAGSGLVRRETDGTLRRWTRADGLRSEDLRALYSTPAGLYIGTFGGGLSLLLPDDTLRTWGPDEGLHNAFVTSIHVDDADTVWIGTYGGGLFRLKDGAIAQIDEAHGLDDNVVFDIMEDRSRRLWLMMNQGVSVVAIDAANRVADGALDVLPSTFLGEAEGISGFDGTDGNQPQSWLARDGRIWFATTTGVAIVDPSRVGAPAVPPPVHVDRLVVRDRDVPLADDGLEIAARDLLIAFSAPELRNAARLRYQHRLVGYDDEWSAPGTARTASFTNLPPGTYTFEVRAQLGRGGPFTAPTAVTFSIPPYFYETRWFHALVGLALTAMLAAAYWLRIRGLRRREETLQQLVDTRTAALRHEVSERTRVAEERRLLDERMQQAQRQEGMGALASGMAHDFNNLLVGVLGEASLALADLAPGTRARAHLQRIEQAALEARDLTAQMLAYAGRGGCVRTRVDIGRILRDTVRLMSPIVGRGVAVSVSVPADLPDVEGDPSQLRQVVQNLLTNAVDAIGDGPGRIEVRAEACIGDARDGRALAHRRCVRIQVSDDGAGMDAATAARVFDPLFSTKPEGGGLGLAAAHGIVRSHGGSIAVDSGPGCGTTFAVLLPCRDVTARTPGAAPGVGAIAGDPADADAPVVLVVDDERTVRDVARAALAAAGFQVELVDSGEAAIAAFREAPDRFGLVVLDLTMPGASGRHVFEAIRRICPSMPVLLTSGFPAEEVSDLIAEPLVTFIAKPWRPHDLVARGRELLRGRPVAS